MYLIILSVCNDDFIGFPNCAVNVGPLYRNLGFFYSFWPLERLILAQSQARAIPIVVHDSQVTFRYKNWLFLLRECSEKHSPLTCTFSDSSNLEALTFEIFTFLKALNYPKQLLCDSSNRLRRDSFHDGPRSIIFDNVG